MVTYRTMAVCGGVVFAWLATRPAAFWKAAGNALDPVQLETKRRGGDRAVKPSDYDLADACEQWLAVVASTIDQDGGLGADDLGGRAPAAGLSVTRQAAHTLIAKNAAGAKLLPPALQEQLTRDMVGVTEYLAALKSSAAFAELLAQVDFPRFVADLMAGVFDAIVDMNVQQMKAYRELLAAAAASLARFRDPDSDETRLLAHLCDLWPPICRELSGVTAPAGAGPHPALDSIAAGAWRRLASSRQQLLATFVLMAAAAIKASPAASRP